MTKLKFEWKILNRNQVALIFDQHAFAAFQSVAESRGVETTDLITNAIVKLLGPVLSARVDG